MSAAMRPPKTDDTEFREGQILSAADLNAAARALREQRWQHNRELHGFGIIRGLEIAWHQAGLVLGAGRAIDPHGRELVVARPRTFGTADDGGVSLHDLLKQHGPGARLDLWLAYHETRENVPEGGSRVIEGTRLYFTANQPDQDIRRVSAHFEAVYLGRVGRARPEEAIATAATVAPVNLALALTILAWVGKTLEAIRSGQLERSEDGSVLAVAERDRISVSAVGDRIEAASGHARVLLGPEAADDVRRFAIGVASAPGKAFVDRVVIESDGRARFRGDVAIAAPNPQTVPELRIGDNRPGYAPPYEDGKSTPKDQAPRFGRRDGIVFAGTAPAPEAARPWHVYRAEVTDKQTKATTDQLRFEVLNPGKEGIPFLHRLVIGEYRKVRDPGSTSDVERFCPILIIGADGNVIIPKGPQTVTWLVVNEGQFVHLAGGGESGGGGIGGVAGGPSQTGPPSVTPLRLEVSKTGPHSSSNDRQRVRHITIPMRIHVTPAPPAGNEVPLTAADAVRDVVISAAWVDAAGVVRQQFQPFTYSVAHNAALTLPLNLAIPVAELPPPVGDPAEYFFTVSAVGRTADGRVAGRTRQIVLDHPL